MRAFPLLVSLLLSDPPVHNGRAGEITVRPARSTAEVKVDGRGVCCYATENDTPEGRARNRRVEVAFWRVSSDL